eukprot:TRINITY_DN4212_c0_g2_i1.p1 TRINITY_DN4212_c0_g2~~TRINITY_DN4212_c0_g2_i1.p1  ORF type:complete len:410 (-),score=58.95 TRINITY_DN4212_c0_g2_i1:439-1668(-)
MEVRVSSLGGELYCFQAAATWTVRTLKENIQKQTDIPLKRQTLLLEDKILLDVHVLGELACEDSPEELALMLLHETVDVDKWMADIRRDYHLLAKAPDDIRSDCSFILEIVKANPAAIKLAGPAPRADRECALAAVQKDARFLDFISEELWADEEIMTSAVVQDPSNFTKAPASLKTSRELARRVLCTHGDMYNWFSAELRADRELALLAQKTSTRLFVSLPDSLLGDREVVVACLRRLADSPSQLAHQRNYDFSRVSPELRGDPEVLALGLRKIPSAFQSADRAQALDGVARDGTNLQWMSPEFKADPEIVETAIRKSSVAFEFADAALQADRELLLLALSTSPAHYSSKSFGPLSFASEELRADRTVALESIKKFPASFQLVAPHLRTDPEIRLCTLGGETGGISEA